MSFTFDTWKESLKKNLDGWCGRMKKSGINSIYAFVSASALWPVIQAAKGGEWAAIAALGSLTSGLGASLLANKLQNWKNKSDVVKVAKEIESEIENDQDLRKELDKILEKLNALPHAREVVKQDDRKWFEDTLQNELVRLGNFQRFEAVIKGSGAIAQGEKAIAVSKGVAIVGSKFDKNSKISIDNSVNTTNVGLLDTSSPDSTSLKKSYLNSIFEQCRQLSLTGVDKRVASSEKEAMLSLDAVYTALLTFTTEDHKKFLRGESHERETSCQSALEQLNLHSKLVLQGEPGSGKSTFVNFVTLCMAGELLDSKNTGLNLLSTPIPGDDDEKRPQTWEHGALLPVRIILRDFAARGLPPVGEKATSGHLWSFIESELALKEYATHLKKELLENGGIVLLDGLDEVPDAKKRRIQIKQAVEDFANVYPGCRMMVTSRTYAYQEQDWRLAGFSETILAPFSKGQINSFIEHWYVHIANTRGMNTENALGRAEQLKHAIFSSNRLRSLSERPLLLTLMASLHAWRGGSLPEKREELYDDTVDLLLDWWEKPKTVRSADGEIKIIQPSLAEWLNVDRDKVRKLLNELAFKAHASQPEIVGTADISEGDLVSGMMRLKKSPDENPAKLMDYISQRAGLLLPRGVGVFTFPHRTFQEYLAACHLTDSGFPQEPAALVRKDPSRWREVVLLAAAKAVRGASFAIWSLVDELCQSCPSDVMKFQDEDIWGAHIAAQTILECVSLAEITSVNSDKLKTVKEWLEMIITLEKFPSRERALAGDNLAQLSDPRPEVTSIEGMQFCFVPEGRFVMGSNKEDDSNAYEEEFPQVELCLTEYYISRFPITNQQFNSFVQENGYSNEEYWTKEGLAWKNQKNIFGPRVFGSPYNLSNHPVVGISWYEALAFTRWLNQRWSDQGILPNDLKVNLPSEAEWEKAARGGLEIPVKSVVLSVNELIKFGSSDTVPNPKQKRIYPWGNEADQNNANYNDTGIGATSAVGCFAVGVSPYGCEEMSGNVWEWTRSLWGKDWETCDYKYPYKTNDDREDPNASKLISRVLRGGSFGSSSRSVRCAFRGRSYPDFRSLDVGFRVLLSPF